MLIGVVVGLCVCQFIEALAILGLYLTRVRRRDDHIRDLISEHPEPHFKD